MPVNSYFNLGNSAALAVGVPAAIAGLLRVKYGPTIWADIDVIRRGIAMTKEVQKLVANNTTIVDIFEAHVQKSPDKPFILFEDECYTYLDLEKETNRIARFVQHSGVVGMRDTVAVMMYNEPGFISTWFAFNKLGVATAFLNYNLKALSLLHCIKMSEAKAVICGREAELLAVLLEIMPELKALGITIWVHGREEDVLPASVSHFDFSRFPDDHISRDVREGLTLEDMSCYIFTSGTTGLPKPCNVPHSRMLTSTYIWSMAGFENSAEDVLYIPLPLYHSSGLFAGFNNILKIGGTAAISHRFSATKFWDEVRKYRATIIQYIGETCRYLLAQPPKPDDGRYDHRLRIAIGNGLRPDIWEEFQRRFNIETIAEFFAATEGNAFIVNCGGKVGACGRYTPLIKALTGMIEFIQCDIETAQPIRDKNGMCILVPPGQPGMPGLLVSKITPDRPVEGYKGSNEANERKLLRDVKTKGDLYFNTGDMLSYDKDGYIYFMDRLGDTFRWKGENVATTEVAEVLHRFPGIQEANVYGVKVPSNLDGRAGMAAIILAQGTALDTKKLYHYVTKNLPSYACPKFLRITSAMDVTGTFKHKKTDLVKEGFDPNLVSDPMYFLETEKKTYVPLDQQVMQKIVAGKAKL
ncbi:long-chain fatty acid transport protein 6-like [Amphiura filiformis]|uniref:long-chain fatty acid transport protein 6-like n=1 Tax=Amphiura filiformis TaxID=82378 RepID=UPI003B20EE28